MAKSSSVLNNLYTRFLTVSKNQGYPTTSYAFLAQFFQQDHVPTSLTFPTQHSTLRFFAFPVAWKHSKMDVSRLHQLTIDIFWLLIIMIPKELPPRPNMTSKIYQHYQHY